jgi:DNA-directed RNA polymerase specialized sigma24 family protein
MVHSKNSSFEKKTLSIVHLLHPYVKQRLRVGENLGVLPINMFKTNEIIDEVLLSIYENETNKNIEISELRLLMFELTNKKLQDLFENEKWHKKSISTKILLDEELKQLEENFTVDADNDLIMDEDLDDISYHQNDHELHSLANDGSQENVLELLDIEDTTTFDKMENMNVFDRMYKMLPLQTSNVVDMYILGKLNIREISLILNVNILEVKRIIDFVKENIKKYIN